MSTQLLPDDEVDLVAIIEVRFSETRRDYNVSTSLPTDDDIAADLDDEWSGNGREKAQQVLTWGTDRDITVRIEKAKP